MSDGYEDETGNLGEALVQFAAALLDAAEHVLAEPLRSTEITGTLLTFYALHDLASGERKVAELLHGALDTVSDDMLATTAREAIPTVSSQVRITEDEDGTREATLILTSLPQFAASMGEPGGYDPDQN